GIEGSSSTAFNSVDLWLKAEYVPSARFGASYQTLSSRWHRSEGPLTADWHLQRRDGIFRLFAAARDHGLGPRAQATLATTRVGERHLAPARFGRRGAARRGRLGRGALGSRLDQPRCGWRDPRSVHADRLSRGHHRDRQLRSRALESDPAQALFHRARRAPTPAGTPALRVVLR